MKAIHGVMLAKVLDFGVRFVTSVWLARWLGPSDRGVLTFGMLIITWTVLFGNVSFADATIYLVGGNQHSAAAAAGMLGLFSLTAGLLYVTLLGGVLFLGALHWPVEDRGAFILLLTLVPLNLLANNGTAILQALRRYTAFNVLLILRSCLLLLAVAIAVELGGPHLMAVMLAMVISSLLYVLLVTAYIGWVIHWRPIWSWEYLKAAWCYGIRSHISVILANVSLRFDQFVLGAWFAPTHLGWYATAVTITELPHLLSDSVAVVLLPKVAANPVAGGTLTAQASRSVIVLMLLMVAGLVICAPVAIPWIYGPAFTPAVVCVYYLLPSVICLSVSKVLTKYICGVGRPGLCLYSNAASSIAAAAMIFPMVHHYGIAGAAMTSSCAYAVGAVVDLLITSSLTALRWREFLLPRKTDLQMAMQWR